MRFGLWSDRIRSGATASQHADAGRNKSDAEATIKEAGAELFGVATKSVQSHCAGNRPGGSDEGQSLSSRILVDERQRDRATRVEQRVVEGTEGAGLEGTVDRTALRKPESKLESGLRQSDRNRLMRTRMSGGVGAEGGNPLGYPISPSHGMRKVTTSSALLDSMRKRAPR